MDLSKSDTICVYCGTDLEEVKRLRSQRCRIELAVNAAQGLEEDEHVSAIAEILSSTVPCPHAEEARRLGEAVEYALVCSHLTVGQEDELRRRAKEEK